MTATLDRAFPRLEPQHLGPLRTSMGEPVGSAWRIRWRGVLWLLPVLAVAALVHAWGMANYPRYVDDPGTYLSQAWAVQYEHALSPYTYFYDHAPGGWIQIALWSMATDGFDRHDSAIAFGNECMLLAKLASVALLFWLSRRLGFARPAAAATGLLFALSPLALTYTRWTFLDNLVTPWILLAFALAVSRRRAMVGVVGASLAFGMAALTKETSLLLAPAFCWAVVQYTDRRNRPHVLLMSGGLGVLLMSSYVVYALAKGELFEGPGHTSLLGTAKWQLLDRQASGSLLDPTSSTFATVVEWLKIDPYLPLGGLAVVPLLIFVRRLGPPVCCVLLEMAVLLKGGYVPAMHVVTFLPWCALLLVGAVEVLRGNPALQMRPRSGGLHLPSCPSVIRIPAPRTADQDEPTQPIRVVTGGTRRRTKVVRRVVAALVVAAVMVPVVPAWRSSLVTMTTVAEPPELAQATAWVADNVPRSDVVVVHDAIWTDLVHHLGFQKDNVIMAYKLDADPAVHDRLTRLNYLVVPDWYYTAQVGKYPTLIEARDHAVAEARFGTGPDAVTVWRVSRKWAP
jgi:hypothetical protein